MLCALVVVGHARSTFSDTPAMLMPSVPVWAWSGNYRSKLMGVSAIAFSSRYVLGRGSPLVVSTGRTEFYQVGTIQATSGRIFSGPSAIPVLWSPSGRRV